MKLRILSLVWCLLASFATTHAQTDNPYRQVIIWGHKLHSNTFSYVHQALYKSFNNLGFTTLWLDNNDNLEGLELSNSLFVTEGQVDSAMPRRNDCWYILHNCNHAHYQTLMQQHRCLILQVYTHNALERTVQKLDGCTYFEPSTGILFMPWATDLLPEEIEAIKQQLPLHNKQRVINWIGTIWDGVFGNKPEITAVKRACADLGIAFAEHHHADQQNHIRHIQESIIAPAIQGTWQCQKGYIPCRIFKNISYGAIGATNSATVYELFDGKIVYNADPYQLCREALHKAATITLDEQRELMTLVQEKHTYITRIHHMLNCLQRIAAQGATC